MAALILTNNKDSNYIQKYWKRQKLFKNLMKRLKKETKSIFREAIHFIQNTQITHLKIGMGVDPKGRTKMNPLC